MLTYSDKRDPARATLRRTATASLASGLVLTLVAAGPPGPAAADAILGPAPQKVKDVYLPNPPGVALTLWVTGLEAPWSLVFLPDGRALVSERPGRIRLIENGALRPEPYAVLDASDGGSGLLGFAVRLAASGEGGLMGLALHPRFPAEPYVYAMHTYRAEGGTRNRVVRLKDEGRRASFDRVIVDGIPGAMFHNGGRIAFGPDGMLYVTTGEIFQQAIARDLKSLGGKILRVTPDGAIPADNPFPGSSVWSYGHRNPQGIAWHPETRELFASEHGPSGELAGQTAYDEVNVVRKGGNHGWPDAVGVSGRRDFVDPIVAWPDLTTPPSGIAFYRGDLYVATLQSVALIRIGVRREGPGYAVERVERWFASGAREGSLGRLRDVVAGPDGKLYILTNNRDGRGRPREGDDKIIRLDIGG